LNHPPQRPTNHEPANLDGPTAHHTPRRQYRGCAPNTRTRFRHAQGIARVR
jgi:hypothetical protein